MGKAHANSSFSNDLPSTVYGGGEGGGGADNDNKEVLIGGN